jgi:predicted RNase H-like HicB family nuclease
MRQYFYPAIFHTAEEGGFWVSFPDFPECLTEGDSAEDAYQMAIEALGLALTDRRRNQEPLPAPSAPNQIPLDDDSHIVIIQFDMEAYQKKHNSKAVKKTLSIPEWLNEEAIALGINFSQVLQEALLTKIHSH